MNEKLDLSGRWIGIYNYPTALPPERFDAELRESGGILTGLTREDDKKRGGTLHAIIDGRRAHLMVTFAKRYDDFEAMPHVVSYIGSVDPDGDEIEGRWEIRGAWSGTFLMVREGKAEAKEERQAGETIDVTTGAKIAAP